MSNRNRPSGIEREIRRRRQRRMAELNRNDHEIFTMMLKITMAALAVIIGICIWFWAAVQQAHEVQAAVLRHHRITASSLVDIPLVEPLPELPPEDGEPPEAIEIRTATQAEAIPKEQWESLGTYKLTFYCACRKCSGKWGHRTSSGATCEEGITVACAVLPAGTHVWIEGFGERIVQDTGAGVKGKHIDIFMESHNECLKNGVQYKEVRIKR